MYEFEIGWTDWCSLPAAFLKLKCERNTDSSILYAEGTKSMRILNNTSLLTES
jgi:hypothetical protein